MEDDGLSEQSRRILDFEHHRYRQAGAKEQAIRELFDMTATRYYQLLNMLIDDPSALVYAPVLINRLRRIRSSRARRRAA